jgi:hypothetical protein
MIDTRMNVMTVEIGIAKEAETVIEIASAETAVETETEEKATVIKS